MIVCCVSVPAAAAGGFDGTSRVRREIRSEMVRAMVAMGIEKGITGMGLGPETDFAEACIELKVPYIAGIAFDGWDGEWPKESRKRYWDLLEKAEEVIFVCGRGYAPWKVRKRNEWMVARSGGMIAVWDGFKGFTGDCVKAATAKGLRVKIIDPRWNESGRQEATWYAA